MKIHMSFVTNSSSSSFIVSFDKDLLENSFAKAVIENLGNVLSKEKAEEEEMLTEEMILEIDSNKFVAEINVEYTSDCQLDNLLKALAEKKFIKILRED
jgi:hypothetical protein